MADSRDNHADNADGQLYSSNPGSFSERLKRAIGDQSVLAFSKECGISDSLIRKYLAGSLPGIDNLVAMARAANVNIAWLAAGEGSEHTLLSPPGAPIDNPASSGDFEYVPLFDVVVSAGNGIFPGNETKLADLAFTKYWLRKMGLSSKDLAAIRVQGDSMEPSICAGDTILVDTSQKQIKDGAVYVIRDGELLLVKRLQRRLGNRVEVISDNKAYRAFEASTEELDVVGRAVWKGGLL